MKTKPIKVSEHAEQVEVYNFCKWMETTGKCAELGLLYAIPNGAKLPYMRNKKGMRYSPQALRLKAEGMQSGVPDLHLPVARKGYHGYYLEMKIKGNKPRPEQIKWHKMLREQGYLVDVPYSAEEAIRLLLGYMGLKGEYYENFRGR